MSTHSEQGVGYLWNLMVGFAVLVLFGICTFLIFQVGGLKKPTDRVIEGDFSADQTALRIKNLEEVRQEQAAAVKSAQLDSAIQNFKAAAPAATEVVVPGSPTSLKAAAQPPAPAAPEDPPAEAKTPAPEKAAPKGNGAAKGKGSPKGKATPKGKAKPKGGKAKAEAPGKGKGSAKGSQPAKGKGIE